MMKGFAAWLHDLDGTDPYLVGLKSYATTNAASWPYWSDTLNDYKALIATAPVPSQPDLLQGLATYFERWNGQRTATLPPKVGAMRAISDAFAANPGKAALALFGLIFAGFIVFALFNDRFFESLGKTEQVRGMVTFFFVLATTGIIVLFAISIIWMNADEVAKRFGSAKDLLTVVIGVLGTIMGFYFGSATGDTANMSISAFSPPVIHATDNVTITGHISGGTKPYKYSVAFADPSKNLTSEQLNSLNHAADSKDGTISWDVKGPAPKDDVAVAVSFTVTATDAKNANATSTGTLHLEPAKKTPPAPPAGK